jgi:hypothetical protein
MPRTKPTKVQLIRAYLDQRHDIIVREGGHCRGIGNVVDDPKNPRTLQEVDFHVAPRVDISKLSELETLFQSLRDGIGIVPDGQSNLTRGRSGVSTGELVYFEEFPPIRLMATFRTHDPELVRMLSRKPDKDGLVVVKRTLEVGRDILVRVYPTDPLASERVDYFELRP